MLFQGQEFLEDKYFRDTAPLDWAKLQTWAGIHLLYRDLIRLRLNKDGQTRGLCGQHVEMIRVDSANKMIAGWRRVAVRFDRRPLRRRRDLRLQRDRPRTRAPFEHRGDRLAPRRRGHRALSRCHRDLREFLRFGEGRRRDFWSNRRRGAERRRRTRCRRPWSLRLRFAATRRRGADQPERRLDEELATRVHDKNPVAIV